MALLVALICAGTYFDLEIPGYMSDITVQIQLGDMDPVVHDGLMMVGCTVMSLAAMIGAAAITTYVATSLARRLRRLQFERVESFSTAEMNRFSAASLITRSTNDVAQVQNVMTIGMLMLIKAPITAGYAILKISTKQWDWTAETALTVVAVMLFMGLTLMYVVPRFKRIQGYTDSVNRLTRENLTGMRVVRAFNAESYQEGKFDRADEDLTGNNLSAFHAMAFLLPSIMLAMNILSMAIYWTGAYLIDDAYGPEKLGLFSDMVVFSSYAMQVIISFVLLVVVFMVLPRAQVAAGRIEEVIDTEPSIRDGRGTDAPRRGSVEFRDVSFAYPGAGADALDGITFRADPGETVAIIGATGSGKSTVLNLIPRFLDATSGQVLVDGMDVRDYELDDLRTRLGYVPQRAFLFKGTIESNVRFGKGSERRTLEDVKRAVAIAQSTDFVESRDGGYDAAVDQGGSNLSGGQKQRISIARAVCRDPEIYIFDDSFSALDYRTDRAVRKALQEETGGSTRIIVAQRIGTVMDADRIVVLKDGRIAGIGRHSDLLRDCPEYLEIARSQLSEKELGL